MPDRSDWTLKRTPEEYLEMKPYGPKADLAREILAQEAEILGEDPPAVPEGMEPVDGDGYYLSSWGGRLQYVCNKCPFDTLSLDVIQSHVRAHK